VVSFILELERFTEKFPETRPSFHHGSKRGNGDMHGRKRISVVIYGSMRVVSLSFIILYLLVSLSLGYGRS